VTVRELVVDGFRGEATGALAATAPDRLAAAARRLLDPASAVATVHWGRSYLYRAEVATESGALDVVVKQFRETGWRARRRRGSRAERSFRAALRLAAAGLATAEPLLWLADPARAVSIYACRYLPGRIEARYLLRARNAGREREEFPHLDCARFLEAAARLARALHDAGVWHRDFSIGNLLVRPGAGGEAPEIALVDLARCRLAREVTTGERMRDLARLALERRADREALLAAYFGGAPPLVARVRYELARRAFHGRHRLKNRWRARWAKLRSWLVPRGAHAHIPPPPAGAPPRERIVWDPLSDQPHSHAGRLARAAIRLADAGDHLASAAAALGAAPRIVRKYRELVAERNREPFAWPGVGVALRPYPRDPEALLAAAFELGVRQALVRLHPWSVDPAERAAEVELASALASAGVEVAFALAQNRELVRDLPRWRAAVEEIAERFTPYGHVFQIGQAINRSKWGIWKYGDYLELAAAAAEVLRKRPGVELLGPAVIDFEPHATAAVANRRPRRGRELRFDALASLLYVDRRGAPERRQLGFDTAGKATLLAAIAETSRLVGARRQWITEVNWPLAEGPHAPAGRSVAVDEETQADYLGRYFLLALGTGYVERAYWWQLVARGYGLVDPEPDGTLRRRPAHAALRACARLLPPGSRAHGPLPAAPGVHLHRFTLPAGGERLAAWSSAGRRRARLPFAPARAFARDGEPRPAPDGAAVELGPGVAWFDAPEGESAR
jgi:hypothetical protein